MATVYGPYRIRTQTFPLELGRTLVALLPRWDGSAKPYCPVAARLTGTRPTD